MHNINHVFHHCCNLLDKIGIEYGEIVSVTVNTRAKKRWGQCCVEGYRTFSIDISSRLLDNSVDIKRLENTMLHELLHSVPGCMNHGDKWKMYAEKVNRAYGYDIKRCASYEEQGVSMPEPSEYKYNVTCEHCNATWNFNRRRKWFSRPHGGAVCPHCKNRDFRIIQNH